MAPKPQEVSSVNRTSGNQQMHTHSFVSNGFDNEHEAPARLSMSSVKSNAEMDQEMQKTGYGTTENEDINMDFDDFLPHVGQFGIYQKLLFMLMIPFELGEAFVYFTQIFLTLVPEDHWCRVPELEHLSIEER